MKRVYTLALLTIPLTACADSGPVGLGDPIQVGVMTRNLYLGTSLEPVLQVSNLSELPGAVAETWADVQATDFPERAGALAVEIAEERPHVVGLQEVTLFRLQSPGDFFLGNLRSATDTALDYLGLLLDSLTVRGASYVVAARTVGFDAEAPLQTASGLDDLRVTDSEVILVRSDLDVGATGGANFERNLVVSLGDASVTIRRGWAAARVTLGGRSFRFVSTHLEPAETGPDVQVAQAEELLDSLAAVGLPTILVGDFNSAADGSTTATYSILTAAGFRDAWSDLRPDRPGPTCCQRSDLRNETSVLGRRIDLILHRGPIETLAVRRLGADPDSRTASGLWPSDHAGVSARLRVR